LAHRMIGCLQLRCAIFEMLRSLHGIRSIRIGISISEEVEQVLLLLGCRRRIAGLKLISIRDIEAGGRGSRALLADSARVSI